MARREIEIKHSGGFGLGWIAIAIVILSIVIGNVHERRIDCALGIDQACKSIEQEYIDAAFKKIEEKQLPTENLNNE